MLLYGLGSNNNTSFVNSGINISGVGLNGNPSGSMLNMTGLAGHMGNSSTMGFMTNGNLAFSNTNNLGTLQIPIQGSLQSLCNSNHLFSTSGINSINGLNAPNGYSQQGMNNIMINQHSVANRNPQNSSCMQSIQHQNLQTHSSPTRNHIKIEPPVR